LKIILKYIYPYFFYLFCFAIPLDKYATAVPNIILIVLLALFPFVVKKSDFKKLLKKEVLLFIILIAYISINMLLFQEVERDINIVQKIFSSFLLLTLFIPINKTENLNKTIIISVLICIGVSLFNLFGFYLQTGEFNFADGTAVNEVLIIDRVYLGFLCVLSVIASIGLMGNKYKLLYLANIILCILFTLLISSRIAIILLLLLLVLLIFYSKNKKQYIIFFACVFAITIAAFKFNKNLGERFFYTQSSESKKSYVELFMAWEPRVVIWECNYNILKNDTQLLIGNGFYGTKDKLVSCYDGLINKDDKRNYFIAERFNPHNQYFDFLLSYGILALLLFLSIFITALYKYRKSYYKMALIFTIMAFAFIESFFQRQIGGFLFSIIFISILYPMYIERSKQPK
jgi:O-antigen ligase|tara:strand:+ start:3304 stop:4509 length:1206 start_codon:yes stop_codon:yes gene_type:complete